MAVHLARSAEALPGPVSRGSSGEDLHLSALTTTAPARGTDNIVWPPYH
jgi:hypothetical protein